MLVSLARQVSGLRVGGRRVDDALVACYGLGQRAGRIEQYLAGRPLCALPADDDGAIQSLGLIG